MRVAIFCCCMLLAGCAGREPLVRTVRVEVPVSVPCRVPEVSRPAWALDALPQGAGLYDRVRASLAEIEQRREYEARLEAALAACR